MIKWTYEAINVMQALAVLLCNPVMQMEDAQAENASYEEVSRVIWQRLSLLMGKGDPLQNYEDATYLEQCCVEQHV